MEFSPELRGEVISGEISVSYRLWRRPKVRAGGRYAVGPARIEIDSVEPVPFSSVTADDIRRSGEADKEALRRRAAHSGPIHDDTLLYRIDFHVVSETDLATDRSGLPPAGSRPAGGKAARSRKDR